MQKHFLFSALIFSALVIPACGGSTSADGPDITAASATDTDNGDGTFDLTISVTFDDDVDVDSYTLDCSDGADASNDIHEAGTFDDTAAGTLTIPESGVNATPFDYSCTVQLTDVDGDSSDAFEFDFDLS
jgi:hypothetical protein